MINSDKKSEGKTLILRTMSFLLLLLSTSANAAINSGQTHLMPESTVNSHTIQIIAAPEIDTDQILKIFYTAATSGELEVLDVIIERNHIVPIQIELIYTLGGKEPTIRIVSNIQPTLSVPHVKGMYINKITTIMNLNGKIIETTAHCEM